MSSILQRDETTTAAKLMDPILGERASLSGPSSPMHIVQQHPLTAVPSTTVNALPVRSTNIDKCCVQSVTACYYA
jgi:hypothetical protein